MMARWTHRTNSREDSQLATRHACVRVCAAPVMWGSARSSAARGRGGLGRGMNHRTADPSFDAAALRDTRAMSTRGGAAVCGARRCGRRGTIMINGGRKSGLGGSGLGFRTATARTRRPSPPDRDKLEAATFSNRGRYREARVRFVVADGRHGVGCADCTLSDDVQRSAAVGDHAFGDEDRGSSSSASRMPARRGLRDALRLHARARAFRAPGVLHRPQLVQEKIEHDAACSCGAAVVNMRDAAAPPGACVRPQRQAGDSGRGVTARLSRSNGCWADRLPASGGDPAKPPRHDPPRETDGALRPSAHGGRRPCGSSDRQAGPRHRVERQARLGGSGVPENQNRPRRS